MLFILIVLFSSFGFYSNCTPFAKFFTFIYEFSILFVFKSINGIMNTIKHLTIMHKLPLIKLLTIPKKLTLSLYKLSIVFNQNIQCMTDFWMTGLFPFEEKKSQYVAFPLLRSCIVLSNFKHKSVQKNKYFDQQLTWKGLCVSIGQFELLKGLVSNLVKRNIQNSKCIDEIKNDWKHPQKCTKVFCVTPNNMIQPIFFK